MTNAYSTPPTSNRGVVHYLQYSHNIDTLLKSCITSAAEIITFKKIYATSVLKQHYNSAMQI